jgi:hypothetical protein
MLKMFGGPQPRAVNLFLDKTSEFCKYQDKLTSQGQCIFVDFSMRYLMKMTKHDHYFHSVERFENVFTVL